MTAPRRRYISMQAAAELFDVTPRAVRRWIAEGLIAGYRVGPRLIKVDPDEIEAKVVKKIPTADAGVSDLAMRARRGGAA